MSEHNLKELVVIEPDEVFRAHVFTQAQTATAMKGLLASMEEQRALAWAKMRCAKPREREALREAYRAICKEQERLMAAVAEWRAANPDDEGEE